MVRMASVECLAMWELTAIRANLISLKSIIIIMRYL